jgi:hypothetical protein
VRWPHSWKIIPTSYPRKDLFERIADVKDRRILHDIEEERNARLRLERKEIHPLREGDEFPSDSSIYLRKAFCEPSRPSRFCDGTYPVCYSAENRATAIEESKHSRSVFLKSTRESPSTFPMRAYFLDISGSFHDLRAQKASRPDVYDPDSYAASSILGTHLWKARSSGIIYDSVRDPGGQCLASFSPAVILNYQLGDVFLYVWDGTKFKVFHPY